MVSLALPYRSPFVGRDSKVAPCTPDRVGRAVTLQIFHYYDTPKKSGAYLNLNDLTGAGDKGGVHRLGNGKPLRLMEMMVCRGFPSVHGNREFWECLRMRSLGQAWIGTVAAVEKTSRVLIGDW